MAEQAGASFGGGAQGAYTTNMGGNEGFGGARTPLNYNPAAFSPPGAGGAASAQNTMGEWSNIRSPQDVVARTYLQSPLAAQNMTTSAISNSTGLDQATVDSQIKAQLPKFTSPSFGLASV